MVLRNLAIIGGIVATILFSVLFALRDDQARQTRQNADHTATQQTIGQSATLPEAVKKAGSDDATSDSARRPTR